MLGASNPLMGWVAPYPAHGLEPAALWPAAVFAPRYDIVWNPRFLTGNRQRQTLSFYRHEEGCSLVVVLGSENRPNAVVFAISPIVIDALDAMSVGWFGTHVCEELSKVFAPFERDRNAAAAIAGIIWAVGVVAAVLHTAPRSILRRASFPFDSSMRRQTCRARAAASNRVAGSQTISSDDLLIAAITPTEPKCVAMLTDVRKRQHDQSSIALASEVLISFGSHRVLSEGSKVRGAVEPDSSAVLRSYSIQTVGGQ